MRTAIFSLVISICVALLSLLQFDRYQTFTNNTQSNITALENKINLTLTGFKNELAKLKDAEEAILTRTQNPTFKTAELEYLVRLANTRLEATRDVKATIALLTLAQAKIQTLNDASLSPLSEALDKDLFTLQHTTSPSLEDLWLKVSTIIDQTTKLSPQSMMPATQTELTKQNAENNSSVMSTWKRRFFESLEAIKDFIKIRRSTQTIEPMLTETQKGLIQENLRSLLEQIRLAILTTEDTIYQKAIKETQQWLSRYYGETDPTFQEIQNTLNALSGIQLHPVLPKITALEFFNTLR